MKQGLPQVDNYKVVVLSITYNQSKYIEDTLNGFAMQQTDFPFLCCVFDDASTDGEQDVLKRWIDNHCNPEEVKIFDHPLTIIIMAPDKNNPRCIYAIHLQKVNTWGKPEKRELLNYWRQVGEYIAVCEGDDYWIDPLKLQYQVDVMESYPKCSLCFHNAIRLNERIVVKEKITSFCYFYKDRFIAIEEIIDDWCIPTASMLYRRESLKDINLPSFFSGDYTMQLVLASVGMVYYIDKYMSVYRINSGGISEGISSKRFSEQLFDLLDWFDCFTLNKYHEQILKRKKKAKQFAKYCNYRQKWILLPLLIMPYYTLQKIKNKVNRFIK